MTIQDLGSIGEFIAAVATLVTLVYLAAQVRHNTRALHSSTFQGISEQMAYNVEPIATNADLAALLVKGSNGLDTLTPEERVRFASVYVMSMRRMEAVYMQMKFGSMTVGSMEGFERSLLTTLKTRGGSEWWQDAKLTFNREFVAHVDARLAANEPEGRHPSMSLPIDTESGGGAVGK